MANIKSILFHSVNQKEYGCNCDRCGQWLKNIWTVSYTDGTSINYGIDCFEKVYKGSKGGKLNKEGTKIMNRALKSIEHWSKVLQDYKDGKFTAENDQSYLMCQDKGDGSWFSESYWTGRPYDEYKTWMIEVWIPARFEDAQKEINRFKKVNFEP